LLKEEQCLY
jgi:hypothetical protein